VLIDEAQWASGSERFAFALDSLGQERRGDELGMLVRN